MGNLFIVAIIVWNIIIAWLNARSVGLSWHQAQREGGWAHTINICALVQSAVGFSMLVVAAEMVIVAGAGYPIVARLLGDVWYLAIIVPALGTGLLITLDSIREAMRQRDLASGLTAAYNTAAMAGNIWSAFSSIGGTIRDILTVEDEEDAGGALFVAAAVLCVLALCAGITMTYLVMDHYRRRAPVMARAWR